MMVLFSLLFPSQALAEDACDPAIEGEEVCERLREEAREAEREENKLEVVGSAQILWGDHGSGNTARIVASSRKDAQIAVDGRLHHDGRALGRIGAAVDVFGEGRAHLLLGGFFGTIGHFGPEHAAVARPQVGSLVGLGLDGDRLGVGYQWRVGYGGGQVDRLLSEHELRVSYRLVDELQVVGSMMRLSPGDEIKETAGALGLAYTF